MVIYMSFKDGDFLEIDYTLWDATDNSIIATTDEKTAKDSKVYDEKMHYGPVLFVIGAAGTLKGLDRELRGFSVNDKKKFTLKPAEAFGERDENLVHVMPLSNFKSRDMAPYPGMQIEIDNARATVKSVTSGRVTVDANHPYAGKDILYEVRVVKNLVTEKERIESLANSYGVRPTSTTTTQGRIEFAFDGGVAKNADYFIAKTSLIASAFGYFKDVKKIEVKEEYLRSEETKKNDK
jgi:peptidylprolyl isomerase